MSLMKTRDGRELFQKSHDVIKGTEWESVVFPPKEEKWMKDYWKGLDTLVKEKRK